MQVGRKHVAIICAVVGPEHANQLAVLLSLADHVLDSLFNRLGSHVWIQGRCKLKTHQLVGALISIHFEARVAVQRATQL